MVATLNILARSNHGFCLLGFTFDVTYQHSSDVFIKVFYRTRISPSSMVTCQERELRILMREICIM